MTRLGASKHFASQRWVAAFAAGIVVVLAAFSSTLASAQTYTVVHSFAGGVEGMHPFAGVVLDRAGNLYGTTVAGGTGACNGFYGTGCGIVFELNPSSGLFSTLWRFTGSDGAGPTTVLLGPGNALYVSTTSEGGTGTIISLSPPVTPPRTIHDNHWIETILHRFQGFPSDGALPSGNLVLDAAGNIYGATNEGGSHGQGTVFELVHSNGSWSESILYNFLGGADGAFPLGGVTLGADGNLYGTTSSGGASASGAVFQLVSASGWHDNTLYSFTCGSDGCMPMSGVTFDALGNLYSSTSGIECANGGAGNAFELSSGNWSYSSLYCFPGNFEGGPNRSTLVFDQAGDLYGTIYAGGPNSSGSVFRLTFSNGAWSYSSLHDFTHGADGGFPVGNLVFDGNGNLYGTASTGGDLSKCGGQGCGVVFKITP